MIDSGIRRFLAFVGALRPPFLRRRRGDVELSPSLGLFYCRFPESIESPSNMPIKAPYRDSSISSVAESIEVSSKMADLGKHGVNPGSRNLQSLASHDRSNCSPGWPICGDVGPLPFSGLFDPRIPKAIKVPTRPAVLRRRRFSPSVGGRRLLAFESIDTHSKVAKSRRRRF